MNVVERTDALPTKHSGVSAGGIRASQRRILNPVRLIRERPMMTFVTLVLWLFVILALVVVVNLAVQMTVHLIRPDRLAIGEFLDNGTAKPDYTTKFYDRWLSFSTAGGELKAAGTDLPFSCGGDFLFAEIEQRAGSQLADKFTQLATDIDLTIAGVNIKGIAKFLDLAGRRPPRAVEGRFGQCGSETLLTVSLRHQAKVEKVWNFSRTTGAADGKSPSAVDDLMDDAICQVAVYLWTKGAHANQGAQFMNDSSGLSPTAMASLTRASGA